MSLSERSLLNTHISSLRERQFFVSMVEKKKGFDKQIVQECGQAPHHVSPEALSNFPYYNNSQDQQLAENVSGRMKQLFLLQNKSFASALQRKLG